MARYEKIEQQLNGQKKKNRMRLEKINKWNEIRKINKKQTAVIRNLLHVVHQY